MTLDELIESLQALRGRCPGAATACAVDLTIVSYKHGEVHVGVVYDEDDDHGQPAGVNRPATIHQFPDRTGL